VTSQISYKSIHNFKLLLICFRDEILCGDQLFRIILRQSSIKQVQVRRCRTLWRRRNWPPCLPTAAAAATATVARRCRHRQRLRRMCCRCWLLSNIFRGTAKWATTCWLISINGDSDCSNEVSCRLIPPERNYSSWFLFRSVSRIFLFPHFQRTLLYASSATALSSSILRLVHSTWNELTWTEHQFANARTPMWTVALEYMCWELT